MKTFTVYAACLNHPLLENEVIYVGQTTNLEERKIRHFNNVKSPLYKLDLTYLILGTFNDAIAANEFESEMIQNAASEGYFLKNKSFGVGSKGCKGQGAKGPRGPRETVTIRFHDGKLKTYKNQIEAAEALKVSGPTISGLVTGRVAKIWVADRSMGGRKVRVSLAKVTA